MRDLERKIVAVKDVGHTAALRMPKGESGVVVGEFVDDKGQEMHYCLAQLCALLFQDFGAQPVQFFHEQSENQ